MCLRGLPHPSRNARSLCRLSSRRIALQAKQPRPPNPTVNRRRPKPTAHAPIPSFRSVRTLGPMGWRWHDDDGDGGGRGGLGDIPDLGGGGGGGGDGERCATRRVVQSRCHTEEVEPGRFVRKCEKTEQLLRDCVGRPSELVESKTENTEEDVTDEMKNGSLSLGFPTDEPFAFPGLRSDIEAIEKGLFGSIGSFLDDAERMTNDFLKSFGVPSIHEREPSPFRGQPAGRHIEEGTAKDTKQNDYAEFSSKITDV